MKKTLSEVRDEIVKGSKLIRYSVLVFSILVIAFGFYKAIVEGGGV